MFTTAPHSGSTTALARLVRGSLAAILLAGAGDALARPRPPLPPWPELTGPVLFHETFDWASYPGLTDDEVVIANYGTLRESWTGMALQRRGTVTPFLVPALDANGHINLASHTASSVRFWLTPSLASPAVGGAGPGQEATLLELVATDGRDVATIWSLRTTRDGSVSHPASTITALCRLSRNGVLYIVPHLKNWT